MNAFIQLKKITPLFGVSFVFACFAFSSTARAVSPPPDGGYPAANTAEGENALQSLTTGRVNTACGRGALEDNTTGSNNTATGSEALLRNNGDQNTATGAGVLLRNTTGMNNTANGFQALAGNTTSSNNTANGANALNENTDGANNTAIGALALQNNTTGDSNMASGFRALRSNTTGNFNMAIGSAALVNNTTGVHNTANGSHTLSNNTIGNDNVALGFLAGNKQTTGNNNVYIGSNILGFAGENNACYIASIFGATSANGIPVLIDSNHKLGTATSSARFKRDIHDMDKTSEALFALRPVAFRYKKEIDPTGISQLGLVAEDVEKVSPDLVVRDKEGKPYSVRYDQVNAMLLNEFLKEHKKVEQQQAVISQLQSTVAKQKSNADQQQKQINALTASLQKVSAQLEVSKPAPQTVLNNQ
jgi:uncharacterized coiled-coil protein SlyX